MSLLAALLGGAGHTGPAGMRRQRGTAKQGPPALPGRIGSGHGGCKGRLLTKPCWPVWNPGKGESRCLPSLPASRPWMQPPSWAFVVNSSVYEDGSRTGACHPAAGVFSSLWALGGGHGLNQLLPAIAAGYEAMVNMAALGNPGFTLRGFHPTGLAAPFGAAAACACLLDLDREQLGQALILAAAGGCGLMRAFREASTQPLQIAHAARSGAVGRLNGQTRGQGPKRVFWKWGFLPAYLGEKPPGRPGRKPKPLAGQGLGPEPGLPEIISWLPSCTSGP